MGKTAVFVLACLQNLELSKSVRAPNGLRETASLRPFRSWWSATLGSWRRGSQIGEALDQLENIVKVTRRSKPRWSFLIMRTLAWVKQSYHSPERSISFLMG